jgi:hypothetical protein
MFAQAKSADSTMERCIAGLSSFAVSSAPLVTSEVRAALQISPTGVSQDLMNPIFAVVLPLQMEGMPREQVIELVSRNLRNVPESYRDHLTRAIVNILPSSNPSLLDSLELLAGPHAHDIDITLGSLRYVDVHMDQRFSRDARVILTLVNHCGELIYGSEQWRLRGSAKLLQGWMKEWCAVEQEELTAPAKALASSHCTPCFVRAA